MTDTEIIKLLRSRLAALEAAAEGWVTVMEETADAREVAWNKVVEALKTDFRTAVICDAEMTDEQRAYWLEQCEQGQPAPEPAE